MAWRAGGGRGRAPYHVLVDSLRGMQAVLHSTLHASSRLRTLIALFVICILFAAVFPLKSSDSFHQFLSVHNSLIIHFRRLEFQISPPCFAVGCGFSVSLVDLLSSIPVYLLRFLSCVIMKIQGASYPEYQWVKSFMIHASDLLTRV